MQVDETLMTLVSARMVSQNHKGISRQHYLLSPLK